MLKKGMFTIEAAIILPLILMLIGVFIFVAGYAHDCYVTNNAATELARKVIETSTEPVDLQGILEIGRLNERTLLWFDSYDNQEKIEQCVPEMEQRALRRTLFSQDISFHIENSYGKVIVSYEGKFNSPLWVLYRSFMDGRLSGQVCVNYIEGQEFVRLCRGVIWR